MGSRQGLCLILAERAHLGIIALTVVVACIGRVLHVYGHGKVWGDGGLGHELGADLVVSNRLEFARRLSLLRLLLLCRLALDASTGGCALKTSIFDFDAFAFLD